VNFHISPGTRIFPAIPLNCRKQDRCDKINFADGSGIAYHPSDSPTDISAVSSEIQRSYEEILGGGALASVQLYAELGLFLTGLYGYFVSSVLHIKQTSKHTGLEASTNSFMSGLRYNDYYHISVPGKENEPANQTYDLTGALCEGGKDQFAVGRLLPRLFAGDLVVFHDARAYAYAYSHNFNGKLRPAELPLTAAGDLKQIRRAETPADYFATLRFPDSGYAWLGA
jgi:diaminopimelate decarboxylase